MAVETRDSSMPEDSQNKAIQVAHNVQMRDATTPTPRESPLTVSGSVLEIKIPNNAIVLNIFAGVNNLRFGDNAVLDGTANEGYAILTAGNFVSLPVASKDSIHVLRDGASDVTMTFWFEMLENR